MTTTERVPFDQVEVGMPATHYVGSDSYAVTVYAVERFTTGKRKGQVKAIVTGHLMEDGAWGQRTEWDGTDFVLCDATERFLPRVVGPCRYHTEPREFCYDCNRAGETRFNTRYEGKVAYWSSLVVGYARDHRDPSF